MTPRRGSTASRRVRRLTVGTVAAVPVCIAAGLFELDRALGGNELSWVYAAEWPLIGAYVVYMRQRLVRETRGQAAPPAPGSRRRTGARGAPPDSPAPDCAPPDAELAAWRDYLSRLHAADPPGGPPARHGSAGPGRTPR